jgi:hypothetical protein
VLHDDLLLSLISVMVEPFGQQCCCARSFVGKLQIFRMGFEIFIRTDCCARTPNGHVAAAPPIND